MSITGAFNLGWVIGVLSAMLIYYIVDKVFK